MDQFLIVEFVIASAMSAYHFKKLEYAQRRETAVRMAVEYGVPRLINAAKQLPEVVNE